MKPIEQTRIWKFMEKMMKWILILCGAFLVIVIAIAVFMRYIMHSTLFGSEEILALLAIWLYWIGGAYGSYEDSHISADMTNLLLRNERVRHVYQGFIRGLTMVISGIFATFIRERPPCFTGISSERSSGKEKNPPSWVPPIFFSQPS